MFNRNTWKPCKMRVCFQYVLTHVLKRKDVISVFFLSDFCPLNSVFKNERINGFPTL